MNRRFSHADGSRVLRWPLLLPAAAAVAVLLLIAALGQSGSAGASSQQPSPSASPTRVAATPQAGLAATATPGPSPAPFASRTPNPQGTPQGAAPTSAPTQTPGAPQTPTPAPTQTPAPSATQAPTPAVATSTATSVPADDTNPDLVYGYALTSQAAIHAAPNEGSDIVGGVSYEQRLALYSEVPGERVVVGEQDWPMAIQDWSNQWFQVDGGYIYSAYVWIPRPGEVLPELLPKGTRRIDVDLDSQTASLLVNDVVVYTAPVTTGKPGFSTPTGSWHIQYQVVNETMTSTQAGINDPAEHYDVENVLFTQYFDFAGDALHLNYWQPESTFGDHASSHGCVGLFIQDSQYFWLFGEPGMQVDIH